MMKALRAEFRKLLTVRSTYGLVAAAILLAGFVSFWVNGYRITAGGLHDPNAVANAAFTSVSIVGIFASIVAILLMAHEYRYNTIMYSLTANRRNTVLAAKLCTVIAFSAAVSAFVAAMGVGLLYVGVHLKGGHLATQHIPIFSIIWRCLFSGCANAVIGFLIAVLVRSVVAAIVIVLLVPSTIEQLLGLLLKSNADYLPFTALGNITETHGTMSPGKSAVVVTLYMLVAGIVAWLLFLRRDAN